MNCTNQVYFGYRKEKWTHPEAQEALPTKSQAIPI